MHKLALCILVAVVFISTVGSACMASQAPMNAAHNAQAAADTYASQGLPNPVSMLAFLCGLVGLLGIIHRQMIASTRSARVFQ